MIGLDDPGDCLQNNRSAAFDGRSGRILPWMPERMIGMSDTELLNRTGEVEKRLQVLQVGL